MCTVLVVEDEPEIRNYLTLALRRNECAIRFAQDVATVIAKLERHPEIRLLLVDLSGVHVDTNLLSWQRIWQRWPNLPVLTFGVNNAPGSFRSVLSAPMDDGKLLDLILEGLGRTSGQETRSAIPVETWLQQAQKLVNQLSGFDVPVLVRGETGVGKEVLARKLHAASKRANGPFLKLNCAALPSELVESELFGYERGAFTGAVKDTPGKFEMANGGTVLLDEIGDMDFKLQAKLLQVLQDKEFHRLGAKHAARVDVRVMAATHCDLERAIVEKRFREDLYYRLNIVEIRVPPLRERRSEILVLAQSLLEKYHGGEHVAIPADLQSALLAHDWPGNVRELENVIRKFLVFGNADLVIRDLREKAGKTASERRVSERSFLASKPNNVAAETLPPEAAVESPVVYNLDRPELSAEDFENLTPIREREANPVPREPLVIRKTQSGPVRVRGPEPAISVLAEVDEARKTAEAEAIITALNAVLWNRKEAARLLKVDYKALLYKMKKLGIGAKSGNTGESKPTFAA